MVSCARRQPRHNMSNFGCRPRSAGSQSILAQHMNRIVVIVSWLLLAAVQVAAAAAAELPPRIVAPTDTAASRGVTLDNGMRVLLVSDAKFNKSAASLVVNTGTIDDPRETEGLAHFTEHMLFLGTEKYPDAAEYATFIRSNGGSHNADKNTDHTKHPLQNPHEGFARPPRPL